MNEFPVLIVGGGPVGLSASLFLSRQGIRNLLVERHTGTSIVPKARGINARTMEIYRQFGVEDAVRAAGLAPERSGLIVWTESLAGREVERRVPGRLAPENRAAAAVPNCLCAQDDLEPVLRRFAAAEPLAELRFNTEMIAAQQDADGVAVTLLDRATGAETTLRALYVIAADGAQSRLRRQSGVRMLGQERVYDSVNILFNADLRPWTTDRPAALYFVEQPDLRGTFLTINLHDRWGFLIHSLSHYGYTPADFTPETCTALIRKAVGIPDLPVRILGVSPWEASAVVAEHYRNGRIFLAGDAAHEMPPTGGFGMNTGVQDALNLAWKLAAVLHGQAGDALLDSYHDERQPVGRITTQASLENSLSMGRTERQPGAKLPRAAFLSEQGLIFGTMYESMAVIGDGTPPPENDDPLTKYVPSARPGCRAPHVWLRHGDARISTIDLFGPRFVLLTGSAGEAWLEAAASLGDAGLPPLRAEMIGGNGAISDDDDAWATAYGVAADGAVLVRPDGYVAWRSYGASDAPRQALLSAFDRILGRAAQDGREGNKTS